MRNRLAFILFLFFFFTPRSVTPLTAKKIYQSNHRLAKAVFLVATPDLTGPYFRKSVILIVEYSDEGALGVIINRPTNVPLVKILPDFKGFDKKSDILFLGGPVQRFLPFTLLQTNRSLKNTHHIFHDSYYTMDPKVISNMIKNRENKERVRVYAGYAGWASGQLESELLRGSWRVFKADQHTIFDKDSKSIWEDLLKRGSQLIIKKEGKVLPFG